VLPSEILFAPSKGVAVTLMSEITAPPFCARPVWSRPTAHLPSMRAALAMVAATVTEPVPPMPMTWAPKLSGSTLNTGSGSSRSSAGRRPFFFFLPPSAASGAALGVMVRKDGQKPFAQE